MTDALPSRRGDYRHFLAIPTRWIDNDVYGHLNNVVYYAYFDTVVNEHLIRAGGLDIRAGPAIEETISRGRVSQMPAHKDLLSPAKIHLLTAYVYSLSGK